MKYTFIDQHCTEFKVASMCRVLKVHRSGYYAWKVKPLSNRAIEDGKLLLEIKQSTMTATVSMAAHGFIDTYGIISLYFGWQVA